MKSVFFKGFFRHKSAGSFGTNEARRAHTMRADSRLRTW